MVGLAAVLGLVASGCSSIAGSGPDGPSRVTLLLTDAPGDVQEAVVTIDEIYLQGGPGGRTELRTAPATVHLTDLANQTAELLKNVILPAGTYNELRFVISGGYIQVEEQAGSKIYASSPTYAGLPSGATVDGQLQMPSLGSSGLKVDFTEQLTFAGGEKVLLVDFDISQSFGKAAGNSGRWVMHPVVKGGTLTSSGGLRVILQKDPALTLPAGVSLTSFQADLDGTAIPFVDNSGTVSVVFQYVLPGDHALSIRAPTGFSSTTDPVTPRTVTVVSGSTPSQTITLKTVVPAAP
jgi:hypothetical protein